MKEIAIVGTLCPVFADTLSALLQAGNSVNAFVDYPEKLMIDNSALTISRYDYANHQALVDSFSGYHDVVLTYNDNLRDAYTNDLTLKTFVDTVHAAREAGVARVIVVGSRDSQAFFVNDLRRLDDIDWVFISTENAYPQRVASEIENPRFHKEVYCE